MRIGNLELSDELTDYLVSLYVCSKKTYQSTDVKLFLKEAVSTGECRMVVYYALMRRMQD